MWSGLKDWRGVALAYIFLLVRDSTVVILVWISNILNIYIFLHIISISSIELIFIPRGVYRTIKRRTILTGEHLNSAQDLVKMTENAKLERALIEQKTQFESKKDGANSEFVSDAQIDTDDISSVLRSNIDDNIVYGPEINTDEISSVSNSNDDNDIVTRMIKDSTQLDSESSSKVAESWGNKSLEVIDKTDVSKRHLVNDDKTVEHDEGKKFKVE